MKSFDIFNDKNFSNLLDRVSSTIEQIPKVHYDANGGKDDPVAKDAINEYINSSVDENPELLSLFNETTIPQERLGRYRIYDEIYKTIQIVKRVVKVYTNNIIQKDVVTGKSIVIKDVESNIIDADKQKAIKLFTNELINHYDLDIKFKNKIIPHTLVYGDYFIELVDLNEGFLSDTIQVINENVGVNKTPLKSPYKSNLKFISESEVNSKIHNLKSARNFNNINSHTTDSLRLLTEQFVDFEKNSSKKNNRETEEDSTKSTDYNFDSVKLRYLKAHKIFVLTTPDETTIGYLEILETKEDSNRPTQRFTALINQLGISNKEDTSKVVKRFSNHIIKTALSEFNVLDKTESSENLEKTIMNSMGDELYYSLKGLFFDVNGKIKLDNSKKLKIRFIPCDKMVHVMLPGHEFEPYGTSIVAPLVFPAKLYLLTQLANNIIKLSRASVIRKWSIKLCAFVWRHTSKNSFNSGKLLLLS